MSIQLTLRRHVAIATLVVFTTALTACSTTPEEPPKPMTADVSESVETVEGVPGGVATRTVRIEADAKDIDYEARTVTLVDDSGGELAVSVGPEAVNFDQVDRGDRVTMVYTEETVVSLREVDDLPSDGAGGIAARAPEGEKPEGFVGGVVEMTAVVAGVDLDSHTATLLFPDGSSREVPVRDDVELSPDQVGQEVLIQTTAVVALSVESPE